MPVRVPCTSERSRHCDRYKQAFALLQCCEDSFLGPQCQEGSVRFFCKGLAITGNVVQSNQEFSVEADGLHFSQA